MKARPGRQSDRPSSTPAAARPAPGRAIGSGVGNQAVLRALARGGAPLEASVRARMEGRFGHDLGAVRVSTDAAAADAVDAAAFTAGARVVFGAGQYAPHTAAGEQLLAHELVHVLQHRAGTGARAVASAEREADAVAARTGGGPIAVGVAPAGALLRQGRHPHPRHPQLDTAALLAQTPIHERELQARLVAHPEEVGVAVPVLTEMLTDDSVTDRRPAERLARFVAARFPAQRPTFEAAITAANDGRRHQAQVAVELLQSQWEDAALHFAFVQWCTQRLAALAHARRRGTPPSADEVTIQSWRDGAQIALTAAGVGRTLVHSQARELIAAMMASARPFSYVEAPALDAMNDTLQAGRRAARHTGLRIAHDRDQLAYVASPAVQRRYTAAVARRDRARIAAADANVDHANASLEPVSETPPQRRRRLRALGRAGRALHRAERELTASERALTPAGAADRELRRHIEMLAVNRADVTADLAELQPERDEGLATAAPADAQPGGAHEALLGDADRWQIYQTALDAREHGFPGFTAESNMALTLDPRSDIAADRAAIGFSNSDVGTYARHGEGQYDISAAAGRPIVAERPDTLDLSRTFQEPSGTRIFTHVSTAVRSATQVEAGAADEDVLAKLVYGFFGRETSGHADRVEAFFGADAAARARVHRDPDATRIVGALLFEHTVEGDALSATVAAERSAIVAELETAIRAELAALPPERRVIVPTGPAILRPLDASTREFSAAGVVETATFATLVNPRTQHPFTPPQARALVLGSIARIVARTGPVTTHLEALLRTLRAGHRGGRSGPAVQLVHRYHEAASGRDVWILVAYRHMRQVSAIAAGDPVDRGAVLGQVGSTGNAVSPHVHMDIQVYDHDPGTFTRDPPLDFLEPLDFFPMMRRSR